MNCLYVQLFSTSAHVYAFSPLLKHLSPFRRHLDKVPYGKYI